MHFVIVRTVKDKQTDRFMLLSPVFLAILKQCVSISVGSVCTHIRVPSSHGTSRDVILEKESETQNHMNGTEMTDVLNICKRSILI